jgi:hypothetical protein
MDECARLALGKRRWEREVSVFAISFAEDCTGAFANSY